MHALDSRRSVRLVVSRKWVEAHSPIIHHVLGVAWSQVPPVSLDSNLLVIAPARLRPLISVDHVKGWLDVGENRVLAMIEGGELGLAFDLRAPRATRSFPRVYAPCVVAHLLGRPQPLDLEKALGHILPDRAAFSLAASVVLRRLNITSEHMYQLIRRRAFVVVRSTRMGCSGSARVTRGSVENFLRSRRLC